MPALFVLPAFALAACDWMAVARANKRAEYLFKPATTAAFIGAALAIGPGHPHQWRFTLAALAFCLLGDVLLMVPRNVFLGGLGAFLVAHVCFAIGFEPTLRVSAGMILVVGVLASIGAWLLLRVARSLRASGRGALVVPVASYVVAISVMVASAMTLLGRIDVPAASAAAAAVGAISFYVSDALIGWHRFVQPLSFAPVTIMITYHLALGGLVLSLVR